MKVLTSLVVAVLIASTTACTSEDTPLPLVGTLERDRLELIAEAQERIIEINVTEGQTVERDQVLVQLDQALFDAQLDEARAARERAAQRLAELVRGPRKERIREAQARLGGANKHLLAQQREYERIAALVDRKLLSPSEFDKIFDLREVAESQRDEAQAQLAELVEGTTTEELGQARASLAEAEAAIRRLQITAERLTIIAPRAGTIEALPYKLGERPPKGAPVVIMLAGFRPYARIYVPEPLRARIRPDMEAQISVDELDAKVSGTLRYIGSDAVFTPYFALTRRDRSRLAYLAEVTLTGDAARELPTGLPVEVDFPSLR